MATSNTDFATSIAIVVLFITTPPSKGSLGRKATFARDAVQVAGGVHSINTDRHFVRILSAEHGLFGDATLTEETGRHAESKHSHPPGIPHGKHEAKLVAMATSGHEAFRARRVCRGG